MQESRKRISLVGEEAVGNKGHKDRLGESGMSPSMCPGVEMMGSGRLCVNYWLAC